MIESTRAQDKKYSKADEESKQITNTEVFITKHKERDNKEVNKYVY